MCLSASIHWCEDGLPSLKDQRPGCEVCILLADAIEQKHGTSTFAAGWPGLERPREGPVEVQAALSVNHRELFCFVYGIGCQDVAWSRLLQYPSNVDVC
ncbi:MAG: hypothetical protein JWP89_3205 [Schlesneria sp.]|nr:hypothetical protein [Schlesneria sp.]